MLYQSQLFGVRGRRVRLFGYVARHEGWITSVTSATGRDRRLSAADTIENDFGVLNSGLEHRTVASTKIDKIGVSLTVETGTFRHEACH